MFRRIFEEVSSDYEGIEVDYGYIDAFTQWMIRTPEHYDVVVTTNMFGDIATDLGTVLQGGMGLAASGNIGDEHAFFEPVHGSAPKYAGLDKVNPIASINSIGLMMSWMAKKYSAPGLYEVVTAIDDAVAEHIKDGTMLTYDLGGTASCSDVGKAIAAKLSEKLSA